MKIKKGRVINPSFNLSEIILETKEVRDSLYLLVR